MNQMERKILMEKMNQMEKVELIDSSEISDEMFNALGGKLPQGVRWVYSLFLEYIDCEEDVIEEYTEHIRSKCSDSQKTVYLYIWGGCGFASRIKKYYKLWRALERWYDLSDFVLGTEHELLSDGNLYCGIAELDMENLAEGVEILLHNQSNCYMYIPVNEVDIYSSDVKDHFLSVMDSDGYYKYDYSKVYMSCKPGEFVAYVIFDGEFLGLNIAEIQ